MNVSVLPNGPKALLIQCCRGRELGKGKVEGGEVGTWILGKDERVEGRSRGSRNAESCCLSRQVAFRNDQRSV
jgi:hypothetical protein